MRIGVAPSLVDSAEGTDAERCARGVHEACYYLVVAHRFPEDEDPKSPLLGLEGDAEYEVTRKLLLEPCYAGHAGACMELALTFRAVSFGPNQAGDEPLFRKLYLEKACDEGDAGACNGLGTELLDEREADLAYLYFLRACQLGDTIAAASACGIVEQLTSND
jgi:hypothetical protein